MFKCLMECGVNFILQNGSQDFYSLTMEAELPFVPWVGLELMGLEPRPEGLETSFDTVREVIWDHEEKHFIVTLDDTTWPYDPECPPELHKTFYYGWIWSGPTNSEAFNAC